MIILDLDNLKSIGGSNPKWKKSSLTVSTVMLDLSVDRIDDPWPFTDKDHVRVVQSGQTILEGIVTRRTSSGRGDERSRSVVISDYWYFLEYTPAIQETPDWTNVTHKPKGDLSKIYHRSPLSVQMGTMSERNAIKDGANKAKIGLVLDRVVGAGLASIPYELEYEINLDNSAEMVPWSTSLNNWGQLIRSFVSWRPRMTSRWDYSGSKPKLVINVPSSY